MLRLMVKDFENRSTFGKVIGKSKVSCFLTHRIVLTNFHHQSMLELPSQYILSSDIIGIV